MVKKLCLFLLSAFCLQVLQAAELEIEVLEPRVEMGKYLSVNLVYRGDDNPGLARLDTWEKAFFVDRGDVELESLLSGELQVTEKLRLYPRQTGEHYLYAIALGGAIAKPVLIRVEPSVRQGVDANPHWLPVPESVWQGQTFRVCIAMTLFRASNQVKIESIDFQAFTTEKLVLEKNLIGGRASIRQCWQLTAQRPGEQKIALPAIVQRGRGRWKYYLPEPVIDVRPLPAYLPPALPVGTVTLESSLRYDEDIPYWQVVVSNNGVLETEVYGLRVILANIAGIEADQVQVTARLSGKKQRLYQQIFKLAVPEWSIGLGSGPAFSLRYFDTNQNRLMRVQSHLPSVWNIPRWALAAFSVLGLVVVLLLLIVAYRLWRRYRAIRQFRKALEKTASAHELRRLLLDFSGDKTLQQWANRFSDAHIDSVSRQLNDICFSRNSEISFQAVKSELLFFPVVRLFRNANLTFE